MLHASSLHSGIRALARINKIYWRFFVSLLAAIGALAIGEYVYLGEPITTDENSYLFQAWLFSQGKLSLPAPAGIESFSYRMIITDEQVGWVSRYPPAHALWLVPGVVLGFPKLMVAVAAFLAVWFISLAGERLKIPFWITIGLLFISPYFWMMYGSVLSHTSGLAATALLLWAYLVWLEDRSTSFIALAGLAWAFLFLNRTYTAVLIALPFAVHALTILATERTRKVFVSTLIFAFSSFLGVLGFLYYNFLITGDPLLPTYLYYNPLDNLGFGTRAYTDNIFTVADGWGYIKSNLSILNTRLWGFTGSLIIWVCLSILAVRQNKGVASLMLGGTLLVWVGYGAFWFEGIKELAPIYYYETLLFVILLSGVGVKTLLGFASKRHKIFVMFSAFFVGTFALQASAKTFLDWSDELYVRNQHKTRYVNAINDVPPNSLVLIRDFPRSMRDETPWNPKGLQSDPIIMLDGWGAEHLIYHYYSDKNVYRVNGRPLGPAQPVENINHEIPEIIAATMYSKAGAKEGANRIAKASLHEDGIVAHGVRQYFVPGRYEVVFDIQGRGAPGERIGSVEVMGYQSRDSLAKSFVLSNDKQIKLIIDVDKVTVVEPRVHFLGEGELTFRSISIQKVTTPDIKTAQPALQAILSILE